MSSATQPLRPYSDGFTQTAIKGDEWPNIWHEDGCTLHSSLHCYITIILCLVTESLVVIMDSLHYSMEGEDELPVRKLTAPIHYILELDAQQGTSSMENGAWGDVGAMRALLRRYELERPAVIHPYHYLEGWHSHGSRCWISYNCSSRATFCIHQPCHARQRWPHLRP